MRTALFFFAFAFGQWSFSQGCSDAGFCTMGAMKPDQAYSKKVDFKLRSFEFNYYRGTSLATPVITVLTADMNFGITDYFSVQVKAPYQMVSGRLGDTQGVGDFSISASRSIPLKNGATIGLTLGGKIPSGKSNIETGSDNPFGSGDLPMYYQVSLGTYDLVFGASYITEKWLFATGVQHPIFHQNENDFRWGKWTNHPDQDYVREYNLANDLKRGSDAMLRAERNFRFINFNFGTGLLAIYRFKKDEKYDFGIDERILVDKTVGIVLNALVNVGYQINVNNGVKLIYGRKLVDRYKNPDGLSRHDVFSASYVYRF
ncbi:MAG: hypothetical protein ACI83W_001761 [Marinoscillum sp.]|jgi:hypothetical protein